MTKREKLDASRETRQWIGLFGKTLMGAISLDYVFNEGSITKKVIAKTKDKINNLKAKFSKEDDNSHITIL